jgi:ubiquinone biosynthesis protein
MYAAIHFPKPVKLAPRHLKRYKDVAYLFLKHAHKGVLDQTDFESERGHGDVEDGRDKGDDLAADLEKLGPSFVKVGQLLSTRGDLLPAPYLEALSRLQDDVDPVPYEQIEELVQEELGVRISKAFDVFEKEPYGSASLGQVHRATLRSGKRVAVKVQRPNVRRQIVEDMESFAEIADFMDHNTELGKRYEFSRLVDQFRGSIMRELDYQKEAASLRELRENLREFRNLVIPDVVDDFTTSRVLTMEFIEGTKLTSLSATSSPRNFSART